MTTQAILTNVRDRLVAQLGTTVGKIKLWSGELPDSLLAGVPIKGDTGFTILVGLRSMEPVRRDASDMISLEVATVYLGILRVHTKQSDYETEVLDLLDMVDSVRTALNGDAAIPPWWRTDGFDVMSEQDLTNVSDPGLNFSAFELVYQFALCR